MQYCDMTSAFQIGMMLGQVPIGLSMDRVGARGLAAILVAWSLVTGLHSLAAGPGRIHGAAAASWA